MALPKIPAVATRDGEIWSRWNQGERSLAALGKDYDITPQRVGQVIAAKDREVYAAWRTGRHTLADLADLYDLTPEDVTRIITAMQPDMEEEKSVRAVMRSRVEVLAIAIQEVIEAPGFKLAPNGRLAEDEDGNPLVDVSAKIEAMKLQAAVYKQLAILNGDEKPTRTHVTVDVAQQQASAFLAEVRAKIAADNQEKEALRRQAAAIPGEVVRELPPGGV